MDEVVGLRVLSDEAKFKEYVREIVRECIVDEDLLVDDANVILSRVLDADLEPLVLAWVREDLGRVFRELFKFGPDDTYDYSRMVPRYEDVPE
tara:strand:- start:164 stop:442 length:279 start_codon:yes stop_codon:yes gene_type:complete